MKVREVIGNTISWVLAIDVALRTEIITPKDAIAKSLQMRQVARDLIGDDILNREV
jgi:hypothetical protein